MKQEDKLKKTLREYYDNQEASFSENEWERASAHLDQQRKNGRRRKLAFILVFLLGISVTLFKILTPQDTPKHLATGISRQGAQNSLEEHEVVVAELPQPKMADSKKRNKIKIVEPKENNLKKKSSVFFNTPVETKTTEASSGQETGLVKSPASTNKVEKQIPGIENYPERKVEPAKEAATPEPGLIQENDDDLVEANSGSAVKTEEQSDAGSEAKSSATNKSNSASVENVNNEEQEKTTQAEKQEEHIKGESQSSLVAEQKQNIGENNHVVAANEEKLQPNSTDASSVAIADSESSAEMAFADTLLPSYVPLSGEGLFYELGAVGYYGWKGAKQRDARSVSPLTGINYMNRLGKKSALSFGVQYLQVGNLSSSSKMSRVSTYKYGEQSKVTVVTPTTLHYLVAPLRFHYFVDQKNAFGGGVNFAYLLTVVSKVTTYDEKPGVKENYSTVKLSGYTDGFSWYDSQVAVFYRRKFLNSLALQAEVLVGLTDIKQDAFFGVDGKERNSGLKLSLIYFAFKKDKR
ncbi:hypothetical protein CNR22_19545 [Sphingobacteriaceae bacterium]|nr:hypothetical protein CNR22_19545 [Sphingobacteriaceae bacterium]